MYRNEGHNLKFFINPLVKISWGLDNKVKMLSQKIQILYAIYVGLCDHVYKVTTLSYIYLLLLHLFDNGYANKSSNIICNNVSLGAFFEKHSVTQLLFRL